MVRRSNETAVTLQPTKDWRALEQIRWSKLERVSHNSQLNTATITASGGRGVTEFVSDNYQLLLVRVGV